MLKFPGEHSYLQEEIVRKRITESSVVLSATLTVVVLVVLLFVCVLGLTGCEKAKIPVRVLILPAFEVGKMSGDFPGEAQYYYEEYLKGGKEYTIPGGSGNTKLYLKDGVALCLLGQGKVSAALNTDAVLADDRFDFSNTYFLLTGCAGSAEGYGIMGDVYVISSTVDYDLGHHADSREMENDSRATWFHDKDFDNNAVIRLNAGLTGRVYDLVKNVKLETTGRTVKYLRTNFPGEKWANRQPKVLMGTSVTGDDFWKGKYDHLNALKMIKTYRCPDPYAATEMEDIAAATSLKNHGMLDRLIILRDSVNMDVFAKDSSPEKLWGAKTDDDLASDSSEESVDIFATAMKNNFKVGKKVIRAILDNKLR